MPRRRIFFDQAFTGRQRLGLGVLCAAAMVCSAAVLPAPPVTAVPLVAAGPAEQQALATEMWWSLRNAHSGGEANYTFGYGGATCRPVVGDWNGDGRVTAGTACPSGAEWSWSLRNTLAPGLPDVTFNYGNSACTPVTGDWNGDRTTTIGVACPKSGSVEWWWSLRDTNSAGVPSVGPFNYGNRACRAVTGDWDGNRTTTIGVACTRSGSVEWWWSPRNANGSGTPAMTFNYGNNACTPVTGDWNGDMATTIGLACASNGQWQWSLRDSNSSGTPSQPVFTYGGTTRTPVVGDWNGDGLTTVGVASNGGSGDVVPPGMPAVTSSTHPDPSTWYTATALTASWPAVSDPSGIAGYGVAVDEDPDTIPATVTQTGTTVSRTVAEGLSYLHVRAQDKAGNWGATKHFAIRVKGAITSFQNGARVQKYLVLATAAASQYTGATFELRRSDADAWAPIPLADGNVTDQATGTPVNTWPVPMSAGTTRPLRWNVPATPGINGTDGPLQVRAVLAGSTSGVTQVRSAVLDQKGLGSNAVANVGPGTVNLVSGNFMLAEDDVEVDSFGAGLTLSRTFNSREVTTRLTGPFGPGWVSGLSVDDDQTYVTLTEHPGYVALTLDDGSQATFAKPATGTRYISEPAAADLTLTAVTGGFQLRDSDGGITTFTKPAGGTDYVPTRFEEPGTINTTTYAYEVAGGVTRVTRAVAPPPAGVTCDTPVAGCRLLTFSYAATTTATGTAEPAWGNYVGRLREVTFTAYDPATSAMRTVAVASYLYDSAGRLRAAWDPRIAPALKVRYAYDADGLVSTVTPPGELPWTLGYTRLPGDANVGRLSTVSRPALPSGTAVTTIGYGVPLSGAGAPYPMGVTDVAAWAQRDAPTDASSVFPPGVTAGDYGRASVYYINADGRMVNVAAPGGHIATAEYDEQGRGLVVRELTAGNRAAALASADPPARARQLDTQRVYSADGMRLLETWGPEHEATLANGDIVVARGHAVVEYDQGAPDAEPYHLETTRRAGARPAGAAADLDVRTVVTRYDGQAQLGWRLRQPTSVVEDPGGLAVTTVSLYDQATGALLETRLPAGVNGGDARSTKTLLYTAGTHPSDPECGGRPAFANLPCKAMAAGQPGTAGLPELPVTLTTYTMWNEPAVVTERVGAAHTTTVTTGYDDAGRVTSETTTATTGVAVPASLLGYDQASGRLITTTAAGLTVRSRYDGLGRLFEYTDSDGTISTTEYDLQDRPTRSTDGKGTQTYTYDPTIEPRGMATSVADSAAGVFTARYDPDGRAATVRYPNGLEARSTFDAVGTETRRQYVKTTMCPGNCVWFDLGVGESIHGQQLTSVSRLSSQVYRYDAVGRLTRVEDRPATGGCTIRSYGHDANSNRTSITTRPPAADGSCAPDVPGTVRTHTYDAADRITDPGFGYDPFGRITAVPASATGTVPLTVDYYTTDMVQRLSQNGTTVTWTLDPIGRLRARTESTAGGQTVVRTNHYDGDGDSPSWVAENATGSAWTRYITGAEGDLAASQDETGRVTLLLSDLSGDIIATASTDPAAVGPTSTFESTEFGVPRDSVPRRYGWLGEHQRETDTVTGIVLMGVRLYLPAMGRFLQVDPEPGGGDNDYDYCGQDPVNCVDLDGTFNWKAAIDVAKVGLGAVALFACTVCGIIAVGLAAWAAYDAYRYARKGRWGDAAWELAGVAAFGRGLRLASKAKKARGAVKHRLSSIAKSKKSRKAIKQLRSPLTKKRVGAHRKAHRTMKRHWHLEHAHWQASNYRTLRSYQHRSKPRKPSPPAKKRLKRCGRCI